MYLEPVARLTRRLVGLLSAQTEALPIEQFVTDPRTKQASVTLKLRSLITAVVVGIAAGCKGLGALEVLAHAMGTGARNKLKLPKRLPDTTMGDVLVRIQPAQLRQLLYAQIRKAARAKQLLPDFPLRVVAMDGKFTMSGIFDPPGAKTKFGQLDTLRGMTKVGTVTTCLITAKARPCLDAHPIAPTTNEMGTYIDALDSLLAAYARSLFDVVMYDAGAVSLANACATIARGLGYVFCLTEHQHELYAEARRLLGSLPLDSAQHTWTDMDGNEVVERRIWTTERMAGWNGWTHLQTAIRVHVIRTDKVTKEVRVQDRYYVTSLAANRLTAEQWNALIRRRWSVENQNHNTWDRIFCEDKRPWFHRPQGMVVVFLLRRIAYNMLAIFRACTLRGQRQRAQAWTELLPQIRDALIRATHEHLEGLRRRAIALG